MQLVIASISFKHRNRIKLIKSQCAGLSPNQYFTTNRKRAGPAAASNVHSDVTVVRNHFHFSIKRQPDIVDQNLENISRFPRPWPVQLSICLFYFSSSYSATLQSDIAASLSIQALQNYSSKFVTAERKKKKIKRKEQLTKPNQKKKNK